MQLIDWIVVFGYCVVSLLIGVIFARRASQGMDSYFASGRRLGWLLAGTSMAATAFSSDTPLLITGIVRRRGVWGNWEVWALAISTMFAVFFFSRLWKRTGVLTEVELCELRYSGRPAAILRGFKAVYWGILYNAFIMGAWPMTGLVKVMQETTDWTKWQCIIFCMGITTVYCTLSGFWGVVLTDLFQFFVATAGAFLLAFFAVRAAGGMGAITSSLEGTGKLDLIPPMEAGSMSDVLASPFGWFLGLILIQWWAWKNTDGGGIIVQRIAACRDEKQAFYATLWFNIAQYALRSIPWIITALASLVLLPELMDHERAYPRLITELLPAGFRGIMVASFFAAFMSTMSTHLNWGASYFVNDLYKRFLVPKASEKNLVMTARITQGVLALAAMAVSFFTESIGAVFTFILNLSAAIGPVYLLRWFWWRVNAATEITAMAVSLPVILLRPVFFEWAGLSHNLPFDLLFMVVASAACWLPATLLTRPTSRGALDTFFTRTRPPGFWQGRVVSKGETRVWKLSGGLWLAATLALLATATGPLNFLLGKWISGSILCMTAAVLWILVGTAVKSSSFSEA